MKRRKKYHTQECSEATPSLGFREKRKKETSAKHHTHAAVILNYVRNVTALTLFDLQDPSLGLRTFYARIMDVKITR